MRLRKPLLALCTVLGLLGSGLAHAGPVVLMGIDAEDCGPNVHGPIGTYVSVVNNGLLANTTNGGSGILVIGSGKGSGGPTSFWNAIGTGTGEAVTHVNGAAAITAQSFTGFRMIAVVGAYPETCDGLTQAESDALASRQPEIAAFVNGGGGLFGATQEGLSSQYAYLPDYALFTSVDGDYSNITATAAGTAVGIDDALDVCCWHNIYTAFPSYLSVLATSASTGQAAALGGQNVVVPGFTLDPPDATNNVNDPHTVTATVSTQINGMSSPVVNNNVDFVVTGPGATVGNCTTDNNGLCDFTYTSATPGNDLITATTVVLGSTLTATAKKTWIDPAKADLSVSKTAPADPVYVNDSITYTVTVTNHGPDTAQDVLVTDALPAGTGYLSASASQGTCAQANGTVTCSLGDMANGQTVTVTVVVQATSVGAVTNTASATTTTTDPDLSNNTGSSGTITVNKRPTDLVVADVIGTKVGLLSLTIKLKPSATLRDAITNEPVAGKTVAFSANNALLIGTTPLCTAVTDVNGVASCTASILGATLPGLLSFGYTGTFAGDAVYQGSTDKGALLSVVISAP